MGMEVFITRGDGIPEDEWIRAVEQTEGLRIASGKHVARNPHTDELIVIPGGDYDAEIQIEQKWIRVMLFSDGYASIQARGIDFERGADDPVLAALVELRKHLEFEVQNEEEERLDLGTMTWG